MHHILSVKIMVVKTYSKDLYMLSFLSEYYISIKIYVHITC